MKYIELGKAVEAVNGAWKFEVESPDNYRDIAVETLKLLPSVEVVRCRECKHRKYGNYSKEYYCEYDAIVPYERKRNAKDSDWFCADGEKE